MCSPQPEKEPRPWRGGGSGIRSLSLFGFSRFEGAVGDSGHTYRRCGIQTPLPKKRKHMCTHAHSDVLISNTLTKYHCLTKYLYPIRDIGFYMNATGDLTGAEARREGTRGGFPGVFV